MSREAFEDFIHAAEHSYYLRNELRNCMDQKELLNLANSLGYSLSQNDLKDDKKLYALEAWFKKSKIPPIKK